MSDCTNDIEAIYEQTQWTNEYYTHTLRLYYNIIATINWTYVHMQYFHTWNHLGYISEYYKSDIALTLEFQI